jgi:hypothetical protein
LGKGQEFEAGFMGKSVKLETIYQNRFAKDSFGKSSGSSDGKSVRPFTQAMSAKRNKARRHAAPNPAVSLAHCLE